MSDNDWVSLILVINIVTFFFGPSLGFTYPGRIELSEAERAAPTILTYLSYTWNMLAFYVSMLFFQIQGGVILSCIFAVINGMGGWIMVKLVRGTEG